MAVSTGFAPAPCGLGDTVVFVCPSCFVCPCCPPLLSGFHEFGSRPWWLHTTKAVVPCEDPTFWLLSLLVCSQLFACCIPINRPSKNHRGSPSIPPSKLSYPHPNPALIHAPPNTYREVHHLYSTRRPFEMPIKIPYIPCFDRPSSGLRRDCETAAAHGRL